MLISHSTYSEPLSFSVPQISHLQINTYLRFSYKLSYLVLAQAFVLGRTGLSLCPSYKSNDQDSERSSHMPKVTQQVGGGIKTGIRFL